jgi:hypothetical protein
LDLPPGVTLPTSTKEPVLLDWFLLPVSKISVWIKKA